MTQNEISEASYRFQKDYDAEKKVMVGVNKYADGDEQ